MTITRIRVLALAVILVIAGAAAGFGAGAALAASSYRNNAQGAAIYAQKELRNYRAIPNGTHYRVRCAGFYVRGPVVAGHHPVKVICHLTPRRR
jgi:hypothetical protein